MGSVKDLDDSCLGSRGMEAYTFNLHYDHQNDNVLICVWGALC